MSITDPISDMLTRIRNAVMARHDFVLVPASKTKLSMAQLFKNEGFIKGYELIDVDTPQKNLVKTLQIIHAAQADEADAIELDIVSSSGFTPHFN